MNSYELNDTNYSPNLICSDLFVNAFLIYYRR